MKKRNPQLRALALMIIAGLGILLAGLWWVQIVSSRDYEANLATQSFRTVRIPAVRGKIQDRNGTVLAENRPTYNISLYLEELRPAFNREYGRLRPVQIITNSGSLIKRWMGAETVKTQYIRLSKEQAAALTWEARCNVASNVVAQIAQRLRQPLAFDAAEFKRHYETRLALPFPIARNLTPAQIALFEEQATSPMGVDLEVQSTRIYPWQTTAAHVLGYVGRDDSSVEGEDAFFSYRLPDYKGQLGIEWGCDKDLRGKAGAKSVVVNNVGYRQTDNVWTPAEAGNNVILTIDLQLQQATEKALHEFAPTPLGAAVVMDVNTGDVLALASIPAYNPNYYIQGFPPGEFERLRDPALQAQINRATQGAYAPGSIFKTLVALAALEAGLDPKAVYTVEADPARPGKGCIFLGRHTRENKVEDQVGPGDYVLLTALKKSSNAYFVWAGLNAGIDKIIELGQVLHLGQPTGLPTRQDIPGHFPKLEATHSGWSLRATANMCIGQNPIYVTPLQMAVVTCALANGGKVLFPRLIERIEPQDPATAFEPVIFESGKVRDHLGVSPKSLSVLHEAMLADVHDADGTGRAAFVPGFPICGKTGTAQVQDANGKLKGHNVWFISFAPYGKPRYAVVVMVEGGSSGGGDCAPIAGNIYRAILERERSRPATLAESR